jgi:DNA-binding NarL/FixJ family response regulator
MKPVVLIVEDHPLVAQGLGALLRGRYTVPELVHDARQVPAALAEYRPDLVLLDLSMPHRNGLELLPEIKQLLPGTRVLVVSMHIDRGLVDLALQAGADGFVPKEAGAAEFRDAVAAVLGGQRYVSPRIPIRGHLDADALRDPALGRLTRRQRQVLAMMGRGMSTADMAGELGLSSRTIDWHRQEIKRSLGVANEWELLRYAVASGLIPAARPGAEAEPPETPPAPDGTP